MKPEPRPPTDKNHYYINKDLLMYLTGMTAALEDALNSRKTSNADIKDPIQRQAYEAIYKSIVYYARSWPPIHWAAPAIVEAIDRATSDYHETHNLQLPNGFTPRQVAAWQMTIEDIRTCDSMLHG